MGRPPTTPAWKPTTDFPWPTINGYDFYEVESALQKAIRRGEEKPALFWASELDHSAYSNHLWKRLRIIASEDVGLADSNVAVQVSVLYNNWKDFKDDESKRLFRTQAVMILVRAPKSRMVDHATICADLTIEHKLGHPPIPDEALDKHTYRGRAMGRWWKHFFEVGALLVNRTIDDPYEEKCVVMLEKYKPMEQPK